MQLPSVIALKEQISTKKDPAFTRFNVFLRDNCTCQYCGIKKKIKDLTFDHIIPRSHGGKTNWLNVVSACRSCNFKKGNKPLKSSGLKLKVQPYIQSEAILKNNGRLFPPNFLHETWMDFLYWDTELVKNSIFSEILIAALHPD